MTDHNNNDDRTQEEQHKDAAVQPEPETLKTPDPQEKMEGPVSSLIQGIKDSSAKTESKEEADELKDKNM